MGGCFTILPARVGKTLLACAIMGILPKMSIEEALDVTRSYSVADLLLLDLPLIRTRPFRAPHHTISHAGVMVMVTRTGYEGVIAITSFEVQ